MKRSDWNLVGEQHMQLTKRVELRERAWTKMRDSEVDLHVGICMSGQPSVKLYLSEQQFLSKMKRLAVRNHVIFNVLK